MGYEAVKVMSFQKQLISGGKNLLGYGANTPSQVGGLEWSMLGYEHYKTLDAEKEKKRASKRRASSGHASDEKG